MIRRSFPQSRKISRQAQRAALTPVGTTSTSGTLSYSRSSSREKVEADVFIDDVWDQEKNRNTAGTHAECMKCGHVTKSFGIKEGSAKRCLVLLSKECPKGENNFYVEKEKVFECAECHQKFPVSQWTGADYSICPSCGRDTIPF